MVGATAGQTTNTEGVHPEPLVSVVTPVYNGERFLPECIESVLSQTYRNWEYIIVNNCSTDRTLKIAESYARSDERIRLHNNDRLVPLAQNHNIALEQISSRSRYCKILHADDLLLDRCLSEMVAVGEEHPSAGIVGAYSIYGTRVALDEIPYPAGLIPGPDLCHSIILTGHPNVFGYPTSLLFRSDLVRGRPVYGDPDLSFSDMACHSGACYEVLRNADYAFVHQVLTYVRIREESVGVRAARTNAGNFAWMYLLQKYGPVFLEESERGPAEKQLVDRYYAILGRAWINRRPREYWDSQRLGLEEIGNRLSWPRVIAAAGQIALDGMLNPKRVISNRLRQLRSRRRGSESPES